MNPFTIGVDVRKNCGICKHNNETVGFNFYCHTCEQDHKNFLLDKKKLEEGVRIGWISEETAQKVIKEYDVKGA